MSRLRHYRHQGEDCWDDTDLAPGGERYLSHSTTGRQRTPTAHPGVIYDLDAPDGTTRNADGSTTPSHMPRPDRANRRKETGYHDDSDINID